MKLIKSVIIFGKVAFKIENKLIMLTTKCWSYQWLLIFAEITNDEFLALYKQLDQMDFVIGLVAMWLFSLLTEFNLIENTQMECYFVSK